LGKDPGIDASLPLDELLLQCNRALGGPVYLVLDQFEEYFLYHQPADQDQGFEAEFARAVNRDDVDANFLLSLREDALGGLDRFKGRIPNLLANPLRLEHLDRRGAEEGIR